MIRLRLVLLILSVFLLASWRLGWATTIDLLVVYDTTAANWVANNGGMRAFAQDAVNRMNQVMQNSDVDITFRIAHVMSIPYTTRSTYNFPFTEDLKALQSGQGVFAQVAAARDTYGADLVVMFIDTGSPFFTGLGYLLKSWEGDPNYAHTVCSIRAVAIDHTLTHEIGHNLGAAHSKYQIHDPGPNPYLDNQYSAGWYFRGTDGISYHTIMAYANDGKGNSYSPAPLFSNPLRTYQGTPAGHPLDGDNARLLRQTKGIFARYRQSSSTPTIPSAPTALAATNITSTGFTANWTAVSGAIGSLSPNTTYYYRVRAYNDAGQSALSNVISVSTLSQGGVLQDPRAFVTQQYRDFFESRA